MGTSGLKRHRSIAKRCCNCYPVLSDLYIEICFSVTGINVTRSQIEDVRDGAGEVCKSASQETNGANSSICPAIFFPSFMDVAVHRTVHGRVLADFGLHWSLHFPLLLLGTTQALQTSPDLHGRRYY